ncbi:MAG: energy transducer TonB [Prevotella sp.]|nr:energy transducer TonB [Prevotella sp.]
MEIKKSYQADLEHIRPTAFLLGLVVALALCFVALEYQLDSVDEADSSLLEELAEDMEVLPMAPPDDMVAVVTPKTEPKVSEKLNIVKETVEEKVAEIEEMVQSEFTAETNEQTAEEPIAAVTPADAENDEVLDATSVEVLPEFPGGMTAFMKWLTNNLKYPPLAQKNKIQGKVLVSFIIEKDGAVGNLKLVKGQHTYLDREAMRVMRMMPRWKAGRDHDQPCRTMVCIPIVFSL